MLRLLRLEWINCTGRCLPCHWCRIEENIIENSKKKKKKTKQKKKKEKKREREREGEKKGFIYFIRRLIKRSH